MQLKSFVELHHILYVHESKLLINIFKVQVDDQTEILLNEQNNRKMNLLLMVKVVLQNLQILCLKLFIRVAI